LEQWTKRWSGFALPAGALCALLHTGAGAHPDVDELRAAHSREVERRADDPDIRLQQAHIERLARSFDAALVSLAKAEELGANPTDAAVVRAQVYLDAGWPGIAKVHLDRVLTAHPDLAHVRRLRGRANRELGAHEAAARDFRAAIIGMSAPSPDDVFEYRDALLAAGKPKAARDALDFGAERIGPVSSLQLSAVDLALQIGDHDDAIRRMDALLARNPKNPRWVAKRGDILERAGRTEEARSAYTSALELLAAKPRHRRGPRIAELERTVRSSLATSEQRKEKP